ncbi:hypothetical protein GCM10011579_029250 [Streptomyces albiflavescens]|uniref:Uncharacterized protein n=1 Tax=Streptomyces albiflavescens TaxID=1623582 RepID=A0A917Y0E2_9ACTN|nr:hypothetical protein GCM10011579_029250 [Streptomyces albiflavescens]
MTKKTNTKSKKSSADVTRPWVLSEIHSCLGTREIRFRSVRLTSGSLSLIGTSGQPSAEALGGGSCDRRGLQNATARLTLLAVAEVGAPGSWRPQINGSFLRGTGVPTGAPNGGPATRQHEASESPSQPRSRPSRQRRRASTDRRR